MRTKYVLIERGEGFKNTYTTLKVAEHAVKVGTVKSYRPVTLKEIKALRANEYREADYFRHYADEQFRAAYHGLRVQVEVIDGGPRCEMLVKFVDENLHRELGLRKIYACNIKGAKTWYPETACVFYETGQIVDVSLKVFHGFTLFVCGLTPGILDAERWENIKDKNLAFRCDDNGNAVTGLFGSKQ